MKTAILAAVVLVGCTSIGEMVTNKAQGNSVTYAVSREKAWAAAVAVFGTAESVEEHQDRGYLIARTGPGMVGWGGLYIVWVEVEGDRTRVTVLERNRAKGTLKGHPDQDDIQRRIAALIRGL